MESVITKYETKPLSSLAFKLANQLLNSSTTPDIVDPSTNIIIQGRTDFDNVKYVKTASGAHYIAFGFVYILYWNTLGQPPQESVAVFRENDRKYVGHINLDKKTIKVFSEFKC
jgi:hypothetical protein